MKSFAFRQWVPFPLEQVFAFFAAPQNLPRLMPPQLETRLERLRLVATSGGFAAGPGSEIEVSFRPVPFLPLRVRWTARILEFAAQSHFIDEQAKGPFARFRHRHGFAFERRDGIPGTVVSDDVELTLPLGLLGRIGAPLVIAQMRAMFAERQRRLTALLAD